MADKNKSVLDDIFVVEKGFPLGTQSNERAAVLVVVGNCPKCGAPIYGPRTMFNSGVQRDVVNHTCKCFQAVTIEDTMHTK